jgi:hypothetical protein
MIAFSFGICAGIVSIIVHCHRNPPPRFPLLPSLNPLRLHTQAKTPEDTRERVLSTCQALTRLRDFSYRRLMCTESQLLVWKAEGLPADSLSQVGLRGEDDDDDDDVVQG